MQLWSVETICENSTFFVMPFTTDLETCSVCVSDLLMRPG